MRVASARQCPPTPPTPGVAGVVREPFSEAYERLSEAFTGHGASCVDGVRRRSAREELALSGLCQLLECQVVSHDDHGMQLCGQLRSAIGHDSCAWAIPPHGFSAS